MNRKLFNIFSKKQKTPDINIKEVLESLGFEESEFLVGFNEHINKKIYVYTHPLVPHGNLSSFSFKSYRRTLDDGQILLDTNYSFSESFLRSDTVPHEGSIREEWRLKKYEGITSWLSDDHRKYRTEDYPYSVVSKTMISKIIYEMHQEIMRLSGEDYEVAKKLTALLIGSNFKEVPAMVEIARKASISQVKEFVYMLGKAEDMKLPITDYHLLFETM